MRFEERHSAPVFVLLPLKPAREKSKVPAMQSLPGICVSFLPDLCRVCASLGGGRGRSRGIRDTGCGHSAAALERVRVKVTLE